MFGAALLALFATACATLAPCPVTQVDVPRLPAEELDSILFLIGDAGEPRLPGEPVLGALRIEVREAVAMLGGERVTVAFLGDNLYPEGLLEEGHAERDVLERRLEAQIAVVERLPSPPLGIFVPGNHDWGGTSKDGRQRLERQAEFLLRKGEGQAQLLPPNGCPGPVVIDRGGRLRLIALDTQWWLRKNEAPKSACPASSKREVAAALEKAIAGRGEREAVVLGHHPLHSGGPHGAHQFPRSLGFGPQDLKSGSYRELRSSLERVFKRQTPLLYAAGHDHTLQVLRAKDQPFELVSGAGSTTRLSAVGALPTTLACRQGTGFARLELARDGRVRLSLLASENGKSSEFWAQRIDDEATTEP